MISIGILHPLRGFRMTIYRLFTILFLVYLSFQEFPSSSGPLNLLFSPVCGLTSKQNAATVQSKRVNFFLVSF
jgi:hypothetical protein